MIALSYCFHPPSSLPHASMPLFSAALCVFLPSLFAHIKRSPFFPLNGPLARLWVSVKSLATLLILPFSLICFKGNKIKQSCDSFGRKKGEEAGGKMCHQCCSRSHGNLWSGGKSQTLCKLLSEEMRSRSPYSLKWVQHFPSVHILVLGISDWKNI